MVPQVPESLRTGPPAGDTSKHPATDTTHRPAADTTHRPAPDTTAPHAPPPGKPISPPSTPPVRRPPAAAKPAAVVDHWRVQVAAISDRVALDRLLKQLKNAGYTTFRLSGPRGLTRVQVGPYATRDDAAAQVARLRKLVGGTPYVTPTP